LKPPMGFKRSKSNQVVLLRRTGSKDSTSGSPSLVLANDNPRSFMGVRQAMSEKAAKWWGGKWGGKAHPTLVTKAAEQGASPLPHAKCE